MVGMGNDIGRNRRLFIIQGMLGFSAGSLTTGVFLTGFLLLLGASNLTVGLLMSAGSWTLLMSLLSSFLVERVRHRKRLLVGVLLLFRLFTTLPVFLPALLGFGRNTATLAAVMIITGYAINTINTTDLPVFMMDSIPTEGRESFVYTRMMYIRAANTVISLGAGSMLDLLGRQYNGFILIFSLALAAGILEVALLSRIRGESVMRTGRITGSAFRKRLFEPFSNIRYRNFLVFTLGFFFFHFATASYIPLYQFKYLQLSYLTITLYNTAIFILMILLTRVWSRFERKLGQRRVLVWSASLMAVDFILYGFLTPQTLWILPASVLVAGVGGAGFWACILPYRYNLMPAEGKSIYEAWNGTLFAVAGLTGALAGGKLQGALPAIETGMLTFSPFQIIFLGAGFSAMICTVVFGRMDAAVMKRGLPRPQTSNDAVI